MKKSIFMVGAVLLLGFFSMVFGADDPVELGKKVFYAQAEQNVLPVVIMWTLVLGVAVSFAMKTFMPFIFAIFAVVVFAMSPTLAIDAVAFFKTYNPV